MKFKFSYQAGEHEIFAKDAFKKSIGKPFKLNIEKGVAARQESTNKESKLIGAEVSEDGKNVEFTVDSPGLKFDMPNNYQFLSFEVEKEN